MKKIKLFSGAALLFFSFNSNAQEYRKLAVLNSAFQDVNDNGDAVSYGLIYSWSADTYVPKEQGIYRLRGINNNGDMVGSIISGNLMLAAYKLKGSNEWVTIPFPENTTSSATFTESIPYQISENGRYVAGQMGIFDETDNTDYAVPFVYDIQTSTTVRASNPDFVNGAFYTVNDSGNAAGWVDIPTPSTRRVPILFSNSGVFKYITKNGNLPTVVNNEVKGINKNGVAVGFFDNLPFIYDPVSYSYTEFANPNPAVYAGGAFSSISDDGTVVGMWFKPQQANRYAMIYNPGLGTQPVDLKTYLQDHGATVNSTNESMGAAAAISPNGKFIAGFEDGPAVIAYGWIAYIPELVLANEDTGIGNANVKFYPNPVIDDLNVVLKVGKSGTAKIQLYDFTGKLITSQERNLSAGSNNFKINVAKAAKGTKNLILVINTPEGNRITKKLIVK